VLLEEVVGRVGEVEGDYEDCVEVEEGEEFALERLAGGARFCRQSHLALGLPAWLGELLARLLLLLLMAPLLLEVEAEA